MRPQIRPQVLSRDELCAAQMVSLHWRTAAGLFGCLSAALQQRSAPPASFGQLLLTQPLNRPP